MMKVHHLAVAPDVSLQRFGAISKAIHLRSLLMLYGYSFPSLSNEVLNNVILKLRCLRILSSSGCVFLKQLSDSIAELKHLHFLDLSCTLIKKLPNSVRDHLFCNIVSIKLKNCRYCNSLPPLGQLSSLKALLVEELSGVVTVSANFYGDIGGSSVTKPFASLEFLSFAHMPAWEEWSSIGVEDGEVFTKLQQLHINECNRLRCVDWPDSLPCLTELEILGGYGSELVLESSLPRMPALRELKLGVCEKLRLEELLQKAESIHIRGNKGVESLIRQLTKAKPLFLRKCIFKIVVLQLHSFLNACPLP
ncbi:hypothetical protein FEM48_Zijuj10G0022100 [Ziziphus jujuba var. spinosa]|uniref:R13L1/DRL21-like LRR repeat region domain-containing protein n=1 Tax=Ziziphus jujuba var. spinosa TaxID=714518 RepID=A0A978UKP4_ZIZJJ|nr:hypothetical protein FEM48_Zijuj10G0022100 [Ziziphus jujuba var. spinosa]